MNHKDEKTNIALVGNFPILRHGLRLLLETEDQFKVSREAINLLEIIDSSSRMRTDVLVIDGSGLNIEELRAYLEDAPDRPPVIVLTATGQPAEQKQYLLLGVEGVVCKDQDISALGQAVKKVMQGEFYFNRQLLNETIKSLVTERRLLPQSVNNQYTSNLSVREKEVLTMVCQGFKNRIIAEKLFITENTVRHHLTSIFEKLKVSSRLELVVFAFREELIKIPEESPETMAIDQ
jgi:DNA-binding NarL/FixJ family response regulator